MRPPVKWVGGKTHLLGEIVKLVPDRINRYFEPFVGGGALLFGGLLNDRVGRGRIHLNDSNEELIVTYEAVRDRVDELIVELKRLRYDENDYYHMRANQPRMNDVVQVAARMIYLNKTGFNGLYRVNRAGQFNVPFGRYTNPTICDEPNLRACSERLQGCRLFKLDFDTFLGLQHRFGKGDFIYLDPPYWPVSLTSNFTSYNRDGFGLHQQWRLAAWFGFLVNRGCRVLLSNADVPGVWKLYQGMLHAREIPNLKIHQVSRPGTVSSKGSGRGRVGELLIEGWS